MPSVTPNNNNESHRNSVFLTGATGYVGRHVLADLHRRGYRVTCLVRSTAAAAALTRDGHAVRIVLSNHLPWRCLPQRAA